MLAIDFNGLFLDFSALCKCRLLALHKPVNQDLLTLVFINFLSNCFEDDRWGIALKSLKRWVSSRLARALVSNDSQCTNLKLGQSIFM